MQDKTYTVKSPGSILRFNAAKVIDQLSTETVILKIKDLDRYLLDTYKLTVEEYYNLVVNGDKSYIPKCPCGNALRFNRGNLNHPYKEFCCSKCGNLYRTTKLLIDYEYISKLSSDKIVYLLANRRLVNVNSKDYYIYGFGRYIHPDYDLQPNWYFDQISGVGVYERGFKDYLLNKYNLTEREYYNVIMYGDKDKGNPLCPYCLKPTKFLSLRYGYLSYCSPSHQSLYQKSINEHPFQGEKLISSNRYKLINGTHPMNSISVINKRCMNEFINRCNKLGHTHAILYLSTYKDRDDIFKVGISSRTANDRISNGKCRNNGMHKSIHKITEGDPQYIARLEFDIKENFSHKDISTEDIKFERLNEVISFIRNYK